VLSVYPCGCLADDIVANYGGRNGYPPITVTCVPWSGISGNYDFTPYDVIFFDGADCWGQRVLDTATENNIKNFVTSGGGAIFGHDMFLYGKHPVLWPTAGFSRIDGCCQSTANIKLIDDTISRLPYQLPNPLPIQCTHGTGEVQDPAAREVYGGPDVYDHYLNTFLFGSGRTVFTEWGHCAFGCGCENAYGIPGVDEQKSIVNAIYWAAKVTT
jgi:hypothetical protein